VPFTTAWYLELIDSNKSEEAPWIKDPADVPVSYRDLGNSIDNINFACSDSKCNGNSESTYTLSHNFNLVKDIKCVDVLNDIELGNTSNFYNMEKCNFISEDILKGKQNCVNGIPQGMFDIFSVNRKDSLFHLLASVHLDKHANWVSNCENNTISNCYFADCFNTKICIIF
jgi:hypothetical protein